MHEVVLDLQFADTATIDSLRTVPEEVASELGTGQPLTRLTTHTLAGPRGIVNRPPEQAFWGWEFTAENPTRLVTVSANQLSQHFIRSETWPDGDYIGWERISKSFQTILRTVASTFEDLTIRRAGLRYINRIAVPASSRLEEWFKVVPPPLTPMDKLWNFRISRTWERAKEFPGLSATVTLANADLHEPEDSNDQSMMRGIVLDIDVFNLWVKDAPSFKEVAAWIERAHSLENLIFESCITDSLMHRFQPLVAP